MANHALLVACVLVFVFQLSLGDGVDAFLVEHGFVPSALGKAIADSSAAAIGGCLASVISSVFLHAGWVHIVGNLLYLRVFGDSLEDRLGHGFFLLFFFAAAGAGAIGHYAVDPTSNTPLVGASGAIAGMLGAHLVLFPRARVVTLFPIVVFLTFIEVPSAVFLGLWAAQQFLNGYLVLGEGTSGGIAWFAHIGGFSLGVIAGVGVRMSRRRQLRVRAESEKQAAALEQRSSASASRSS